METILQVSQSDLKTILSEAVEEILNHKKQSKQSDKLLTVEETAEIFKVSKVTLWRWQKDGTLMPIRIGGKTRYRESDIQRLIKRKD
jgi:excisionase family DNA binding protein